MSTQIPSQEDPYDVAREEAMEFGDQLLKDLQALMMFGGPGRPPLSALAPLSRLVEDVSRESRLDEIRNQAYISQSIFEFSRYDQELVDLCREGFLDVTCKGQQVPHSLVLDVEGANVELTEEGDRLLDHLQVLTAFENGPSLVLPFGFVERVKPSEDGDAIVAITPAWVALLGRLAKEPDLLHQLDWRIVEKIVAAAYHNEGWQVVLTPRSGDKGRDVIATREDFGTIRMFDQVKAYSPNRKVPAEEVRALNGILRGNVSKGVITTTSDFAPGVLDEFSDLIPGRLELRNGADLLSWIHRLSLDLLGR